MRQRRSEARGDGEPTPLASGVAGLGKTAVSESKPIACAVVESSQVSWDDLVEEGAAARRQRHGAQWRLGDLAGQVATTYGGHKLERYAEEIGVEFNTLMNYRSVAARFESSRRRDILSFTHHACVAAARLPPDVVDSMLLQAEQENWPVRRLEMEREAAVIRAETSRLQAIARERWASPRRREWSHDLDEVARFVSALGVLAELRLNPSLSPHELAALIPPEKCPLIAQHLTDARRVLRDFTAAWRPYSQGDRGQEAST